MKGILFEKPHQVRVTEKPLRTLGQDEALVKIDSCGICGTDVHIIEGTSRSTPPVVLGHEYAGVVCDLRGNGKTGHRVAIDPNISCGNCYYCRRGLVHLCENLRALGVDIDGGMAEYSIVPRSQLYELPEDFPAPAGAFVEPVSCAIHGIDIANIRQGDTAVIIGGGTIGLLMLQLVAHAGAGRTILIEPQEHKRKLAVELGATEVIDPNFSVKSAVLDLTTVGADVVIECAGRPETMKQAVELARRGGTVEFFGVCPIGVTIPVEPNQIYFRELRIVGSYVNPHTFPRSIALLHAGNVRVDKFPLSTFPLEGIQEALLYQREGRTMKSIIRPND